MAPTSIIVNRPFAYQKGRAMIHAIEAWFGSTPYLMWRVENAAGTHAQQADVSSISWTSYDACDTPWTQKATGTLVVADVVFDTLQTDAKWTTRSSDSLGYNLGILTTTSMFPAGDTTYVVVFSLTLTDGQVIPIYYGQRTPKEVTAVFD